MVGDWRNFTHLQCLIVYDSKHRHVAFILCRCWTVWSYFEIWSNRIQNSVTDFLYPLYLRPLTRIFQYMLNDVIFQHQAQVLGN